MALEPKQKLYFKTKAKFNEILAKTGTERVIDSGFHTVFIEDTQEIWTHGKFFTGRAFRSITDGTTTASSSSIDGTITFTGGGATTVTVSAGGVSVSSTDQSVTSVDNHYTPTANAGSELTAAKPSGTNAGTYALNTEYEVVTGVKAQRDAKGHITGLTITTQKVKDTNSASLQVSDAANKKINTSETTGNFIQFVGGTNKFTVKDKNGTSFDIDVTPSITNNVTGSDLTSNKIIYGNGSSAIKTSGIGIETALTAGSDIFVPTSKAVADYVNTALTSALTYKGTIGTGGTVTTLPATHKVGDVYVVLTVGTYAGKTCEVGDYIICNTAGTTANDLHWDVINGENQVDNKSASLAAPGSSATIATVDGTNLTVTTPSTWEVTDTKVTAVGNHYTPAADNSAELTASLEGSVAAYALNSSYDVVTGVKAQRDAKGHIVGMTVTKQSVKDTNTTVGSGIYLTGYTKASASAAVAATDTANGAIGKLEYKIDTLSADCEWAEYE